MKTYIVLLRGVMPTGKNKVPMAKLREILVNAGFENVRTYIQSGNARIDTKLSAKEIEIQVHDLIRDQLGPDLTVVVRTSQQLEVVLVNNPFREGHDISRTFFVLFAQSPPVNKVAAITKVKYENEKVVIRGDAAYMYIPGTYGRGKLSNNYLEKHLGVAATMRNYNTLSRLVELANSSAN